MAEFKEPKVEFIALDKTQVVYASPGAGSVQSCNGGPLDKYDYCQMMMYAMSGECGTEAADYVICENNAVA